MSPEIGGSKTVGRRPHGPVSSSSWLRGTCFASLSEQRVPGNRLVVNDLVDDWRIFGLTSGGCAFTTAICALGRDIV